MTRAKTRVCNGVQAAVQAVGLAIVFFTPENREGLSGKADEFVRGPLGIYTNVYFQARLCLRAPAATGAAIN
jgi:hypothetical protein